MAAGAGTGAPGCRGRMLQTRSREQMQTILHPRVPFSGCRCQGAQKRAMLVPCQELQGCTQHRRNRADWSPLGVQEFCSAPFSLLIQGWCYPQRLQAQYAARPAHSGHSTLHAGTVLPVGHPSAHQMGDPPCRALQVELWPPPHHAVSFPHPHQEQASGKLLLPCRTLPFVHSAAVDEAPKQSQTPAL